ncbi:prolyl-tRNA synthetase associated domain-containing protein [Pelagibacterium halotolerans]|uniref:prolyl-tRNA synthetase associated domain-containing protein n=1 Tax=Pelagibacterium halotolerans TaxID=531813 RepID=UPI003850EAA0
MYKAPDDLFQMLADLNIEVETTSHPPLFTVEESQKLRGQIAGGHTKNLFVKDKKDRYFLLTLEETATVDLKQVHHVIGAASRVSFGKPEKLLEYLGVTPGAVTVFGAINDTEGKVSVVVDKALLEHDVINAHPLTNAATTSIRRDDLLTFLDAVGHSPAILDLSSQAAE